MEYWSPVYNWTYQQYRDCINRVFADPNRQGVSLDVEHSDRRNMDDIIQWATADGYDTEERAGGDIIRITRKDVTA